MLAIATAVAQRQHSSQGRNVGLQQRLLADRITLSNGRTAVYRSCFVLLVVNGAQHVWSSGGNISVVPPPFSARSLQRAC